MLKTLSQQQIDLMPVIRDRWINWAITPTETPDAEIIENTRWLYAQANLEAPEIKVCRSLQEFLASVRASVRASVGASVRDSVGASVRASVRASVWDSVWDSVRASVWDSVWDSVRESVWASVWDSVGSSVGSSVWASVGAYYWADDLAFAAYFEEIGILTDAKLIERKQKYANALKDVTLGFYTEKVCIVLTKPTVRRDDQGRLSNDQKMAVEWKEGDGFYFLDGVRLDKEFWESVVSKKMTFSEIMRIENADHRALALKYNQESMINENAKLIDRSKRGNELFLIENTELNTFLEEREIYVLRMTCPTGRIFVEAVEPNFARKTKSADACQAAAFGIDLEQYNLLAVEA